jgi:hypothetical protein
MTELDEALAPVNAIHRRLLKMWGWKYTQEGVEAWMMKAEDYKRLVNMLREADDYMKEKLKLCKAKTPCELEVP